MFANYQFGGQLLPVYLINHEYNFLSILVHSQKLIPATYATVKVVKLLQVPKIINGHHSINHSSSKESLFEQLSIKRN